MKKSLKIFCATAALAYCMAFPAMAAETRAEYKEDATPVRSEIKALEEEMKPVREANKSVAAKYKSVRLTKKNEGTLTVTKENWKKARELHKEITEIRRTMKTETVKSLKAEAKAAAKEKNFDGALQKLNEALEVKKSRKESLEQISEIWEQIDSLLE